MTFASGTKIVLVIASHFVEPTKMLSNTRDPGTQEQPPASYRAVPISTRDAGATIRLCALVRDEPGPLGGPLVLLRDFPHASVYLGCITDHDGSMHRLVELWHQNSERLEATYPPAGIAWDQDVLDVLWARQIEAFRQLDPQSFIATGWELEHPAPVSAESSSAVEIAPFNTAGGLIMAREFFPLSLAEWLDLLSGKPWRGINHGRKIFRPSGVYQTLQDISAIQSGAGHVFLGRSGRAGRLLEAFHLKISLLTDLIRSIRSVTAVQQLPFLNLHLESFRVRLDDGGRLLPFFWSAKASLVAAPESIALPVATTESRYFLPAQFAETSIFRPVAVSAVVRGVGEIRIREVLEKSEEGATIEATLAAPERLGQSPSDLLVVRLTLPVGRIDLYGNVTELLNAGAEARFRTLPQKLDASVIDTLRQAEGVVFKNVPFQVLPVLSSPCDLYALGVLAVRALLVNDEMSLPVALDEVLSLARRFEGVPDAAGLQTLAMAEPGVRATFGPHRLTGENWTADEAFAAFPEELWWETMAVLLRFFPGLNPGSFCRDFGDASPLAIERIYDEPLAAFEALAQKSRSMLLGDWKADRELSALLQRWDV